MTKKIWPTKIETNLVTSTMSLTPAGPTRKCRRKFRLNELETKLVDATFFITKFSFQQALFQVADVKSKISKNKRETFFVDSLACNKLTGSATFVFWIVTGKVAWTQALNIYPPFNMNRSAWKKSLFYRSSWTEIPSQSCCFVFLKSSCGEILWPQSCLT